MPCKRVSVSNRSTLANHFPAQTWDRRRNVSIQRMVNVYPPLQARGRRYQFSIAAVESAQTWRLEDNLSSYSPAHQRSNTGLPGPRSTCQQGAFASGGSRGRPISLPFPAVECTPFLGSRPIPPPAQPATATCVLLTPPSLRFPLAPPSSPFKDPSGPGPPR